MTSSLQHCSYTRGGRAAQHAAAAAASVRSLPAVPESGLVVHAVRGGGQPLRRRASRLVPPGGQPLGRVPRRARLAPSPPATHPETARPRDNGSLVQGGLREPWSSWRDVKLCGAGKRLLRRCWERRGTVQSVSSFVRGIGYAGEAWPNDSAVFSVVFLGLSVKGNQRPRDGYLTTLSSKPCKSRRSRVQSEPAGSKGLGIAEVLDTGTYGTMDSTYIFLVSRFNANATSALSERAGTSGTSKDRAPSWSMGTRKSLEARVASETIRKRVHSLLESTWQEEPDYPMEGERRS